MSDKFQMVTVVLQKEFTDEGVKKVLDAIRMVKGVAKAELGQPLNPADYMARASVLQEYITDLYTILNLSASFSDDKEAWGEIKAILERVKQKRGW